jgi:hypothetical protein
MILNLVTGQELEYHACGRAKSRGAAVCACVARHQRRGADGLELEVGEAELQQSPCDSFSVERWRKNGIHVKDSHQQIPARYFYVRSWVMSVGTDDF